MTNPTLTRSLECALGYPEACTDPTCSDPVHLPDRDEDAAWLEVERWPDA
jgi:hypothetical protein